VTRDHNRSAVYGAEDQVTAMLDRGGQVDFHGSTLDLPSERKFGDIPSINRYLDAVRCQSWGYGSTREVSVVASRAEITATWRAPGEIRVPVRSRWALREWIVLHEYSHHVTFHTGRGANHDRAFCEVLIELTSKALSPGIGTLLLAAFHEAGAY